MFVGCGVDLLSVCVDYRGWVAKHGRKHTHKGKCKGRRTSGVWKFSRMAQMVRVQAHSVELSMCTYFFVSYRSVVVAYVEMYMDEMSEGN